MESREEKSMILKEAGFIIQTKAHHSDFKETVWEPTGFYVLPGWEPEPLVKITEYGFDGVIGRQTTRLRTEKEFANFYNRNIPTFCEELKL